MKEFLKSLASFLAVNSAAGVVQTVASTATADYLESRRKKDKPEADGCGGGGCCKG